jgi:hypothetical protein
VCQKKFAVLELGIQNPKEIKRLLQKFVIKDLFKGKSSPSIRKSRRFFPTFKGIKNHIYLAEIAGKTNLTRKLPEIRSEGSKTSEACRELLQQLESLPTW